MTKKEVKKVIFKGNKLNFAFLTFASLFEAAAMMLTSIMLEKIVSIASSDSLDDLITQGIIFITVLALAAVVYGLMLHIRPKYRKKAIQQYKNNIYEHLLKKSISDFNKYDTSTYTSALTNDVNYIEENYLFSIFTIITDVTLFIATIVVMLLYSPILTLAGIILSLLPLIVGLLIGSKLSVHEKNISDGNASFMHFVKDNLIGFSTIKVFKAEHKIKDLFTKNNQSLESVKAKKERTTILMDFLQVITQYVSQFGVFFIGAYLCIATDEIQPAVIILFLQLMNYIMSPLITIPSVLSKRNACNPLFEKIANLLTVTEENDHLLPIKTTSIDNISLSNINFAYDETAVIKNLSYTFEKNKAYAIVGSSGSGKTTLLNLLIGRHLNYTGNICYDDLELKNISLDSLFENMSFVEQNVFIFDDTIINNITMYSTVDEEFLKDIINKSGLTDLIKEKGEDYKCGENGSNLSGGEKQRISIARALVKKSQILLMDEATSALDNETSSTITNNVLNLNNMTRIMITHKLEEASLSRFDEIIVLKNGEIVEKGSFEDLINNNYIFKSLYQIE